MNREGYLQGKLNNAFKVHRNKEYNKNSFHTK